MIENKNDANRNLEKALQALEQAKQRIANEKKNRMRRNGKPNQRIHPVYRVRTNMPPEVVCALSEGQVSLAWTPVEGVVCLEAAKSKTKEDL